MGLLHSGFNSSRLVHVLIWFELITELVPHNFQMEMLWVAAREEHPPRPLQDRMDPLRLPDNFLIRQCRLPRPAIMFLVNLLSGDLQRKPRRSSPLPVVLQIMAALRFFASGTFQMVLGGTLGVSQSSICRVIRDVSNALCRRARLFIKFPRRAVECIRTKQQFFEIAGFPNVLGAVDGTHIAIKVSGIKYCFEISNNPPTIPTSAIIIGESAEQHYLPSVSPIYRHHMMRKKATLTGKITTPSMYK